MPLTFPSHAAAILPLYWALRHRLHPTALVVGSMAPDLAYLLRWNGTHVHCLAGLFTFCLPAGLLFFLWVEGLLLPNLVPVLPRLGGFVPGRLLATRGLPRDAAGWCGALLAVLLGAVTHLLWDGFTHVQMWPARVLYPATQVGLAGARLPLVTLLQHLSSALGAGVVLGFLLRLYPRLPEVPSGAWRPFLLGLLVLVALSSAAFALRFHDPPHPESVRRTLWFASWTAVDATLLGLSGLCLCILRGRPAR